MVKQSEYALSVFKEWAAGDNDPIAQDLMDAVVFMLGDALNETEGGDVQEL